MKTKRTKGKVLVALLVAGVLCAGTTTAVAGTISRSIGGQDFTATTEISSTTAMARTLGSGPNIEVSVSATYYYIDTVGYEFVPESGSDAGRMGARVDFEVPDAERYRSYDINAFHTAEANGEYWSGSTSETY